MKILDRLLVRELIRFTLLACASVVVLYLLIDLFEELNYFTSRKVTLPILLLYYLYSTPSAVALLYPVSMVLAVFVVYGQMTRYRELHALQSAGVPVGRLFAPAVVLGLASALLYLGANELVTIPANARLSDLRRTRIERRPQRMQMAKTNAYFVGEGGRVYYIRELRPDGVMRDFSVSLLGPDRKVVRRFDVAEAVWQDTVWLGTKVVERRFAADGQDTVVEYDTLRLTDVLDRPEAFAAVPRPVEETPTAVLAAYIRRMKRAGENVAKQEVEYHYRFSYALIGLIVVMLGLPVSVRIQRGGIMFGLGLGLLLSFLYWGAIQTSRAYGTSHVLSPALAAWLPNILFVTIAVILIANGESR